MTPALRLEGVAKSFGKTRIIQGVDLEILPGERHALIGPNGAGKSTMFHLISGKLPLSGGVIEMNGGRIDGLPPHRIRRLGLSRSFQVSNLFGRLTVQENLECALLWPMGVHYSIRRPMSDLRDIKDRAGELVEMLHLGDVARQPTASLPYADQRVLEIGMTVAGDASIVLLDEPTAGMNRQETARMVELIDKISEGRTLVMVEHDMGVVFNLATRISVLVHGEVIASDAPANIRSNRAVQEAYLGASQPADTELDA